MSNVVLIGIARMGSTRLPGKVMRQLGDRPVIGWVVRAGLSAPGIDRVWIATSTLPADDVIEEWCTRNGIQCFRGDEQDVLSRFAGCARAAKATIAVRVTCDCPFLDPQVIGSVVRLMKSTGAAYTSNIYPAVWPDGLDCEAIDRKALHDANREATRQSDRDSVTPYITRNQYRWPAASLNCPIPGMHKERWVLDTDNDWKFCEAIATRWDEENDWKPVPAPTHLDILKILDKEPELRALNSMHPRNERHFEAISKEECERKFTNSIELFSRVKEVIPFAAQTFSKSHLVFGKDGPLFLTHGIGGHCYDIDGNDYVDLVGALLPNILGYCDPDVDHAVHSQLSKGISFSLATTLEFELASLLKQYIPCAEMVKFGKSGSDVTSAAVRLARAHTGKANIAICGGYHGWHNWAVMGTKHDVGVPNDGNTSHVAFGDKKAIEALLKKGRVAGVIVEPEVPGTEDNWTYLSQLRSLCTKYGAVLIFDEIITGFRWHVGGAQTCFGITPDLACFGKAMANGMPISALCGKKEIMIRCQPGAVPNIFYSGTMFGETLSIAAAIATIKKLVRENVPNSLWRKSIQLIENSVLPLVKEYGLLDVVKFGHGPRYALQFDDTLTLRAGTGDSNINVYRPKLQNMFTREMAKQGVLIYNSHNLCHAHTDYDMNKVVRAYDHTLKVLAKVSLQCHT